MKKEDIVHGQKVWVDSKLVREKEGNKRAWKSVSTDTKAAIIIGKRTLVNGTREYETPDWESSTKGSYYFDANDYIEAILVSTDMRTKPFYILLDKIHERA